MFTYELKNTFYKSYNSTNNIVYECVCVCVCVYNIYTHAYTILYIYTTHTYIHDYIYTYKQNTATQHLRATHVMRRTNLSQGKHEIR